jgi:hypothetical protein
MRSETPWGSASPLDRLQAAAAALALAAIAAYRAWAPVVDPDLWHEMAWFREALARGSAPLRDPFAYTPTVVPVVHHEWAAGAIGYCVARWLDGSGLIALRYGLLFGLGVICWQVNRARAARPAIAAPMALIALLLIDAGFSTVRAQMYSFVLLAALLYLFEIDRRGSRRWIAAWLALYVAWINLHGGFLFGAALFFLHWLEQWWRGEPHRHLLFTGIAMAPLTLLTPFGLHYPQYLIGALLETDRSHIVEWGPLGSSGDALLIGVYSASLLLVAYTVRFGRGPWRGLPLVIASAAYALSARRMVCLYGIVWLCSVPSQLAATPLASHLERLWTRRALQLGFWGVAGLVFAVGLWPAQPWRVRVPGEVDPRLQPAHIVYPVGAVNYLADRDFAGNVLVGFDWGAYLSWKLYPRVKVSLDSRFEVAYPRGVEAEQYAFFTAEPGWQALLDQEAYRSTDLILAPRFLPSHIHERLAELPDWKRVYRDKSFELFARLGSSLPLLDRPDASDEGVFP